MAVTLAAVALCLLSPQSSPAAVTQIGGPGVGNGTFDTEGGVAVDPSGEGYVVDPHRGTLQKFTNTGGFIASTNAANGKALNLPEGVATSGSNSVVVAEWSNERLIELNSSLEFVATLETGTPFVSVASGGGHLYALALDGSNHYILERFTGGSRDKKVTPPVGSGAGELAALDTNGVNHDQIAVDPSGTVYVTDADNQRVVELDGELSFLPTVITGFTGYPLGIASDSVGGATQVYVGDSNLSTGSFVRRFSPSGTQLGSVSVAGAEGGLATDASGNVFDSEGFSGGAVLRIDTTPDPAIAPTPGTGLTSQTVTFNGAGSETDLWGVADYRWDLDGSNTFSTDTGTAPATSRMFNAPGTYPIGLKVTATNGREAQTTLDYVVGSSGAAFTGPPQALTNTAVTFDGSPSAIPYSSVTDYAWDFDGSGSYALDAATTPTISHAFTTPGTYSVQLRVTRAGGRVDLASGTIVVTPHPPAGPVGVSIDGGDYATNNPDVEVDPVWPSTASQVTLSNDGGFGAAGNTITRALAAEVPWTLEQTGPERLPKTVYVRFLGAGIDTQNFTDDIILDQTPPTLQSAQLLGGAGASAASAARAKPKTHSYRIKVKAQDKIVGVCAVDASARKSGGTVVSVKNCRDKGILRLAKTVTVKSAARPKYVRVRNSADDWSRWLKLRG